MTPEDIRERQIAGGLALIERAESLKRRGLIQNYFVYCLEHDPAVIDHVTIVPATKGLPESRQASDDGG